VLPEPVRPDRRAHYHSPGILADFGFVRTELLSEDLARFDGDPHAADATSSLSPPIAAGRFDASAATSLPPLAR
jgi:hypothetical protein